MGCHSEVTPASGSATSTLALTASAGANTGNAPVTVTGISGALTHSTTIALTVKFADVPRVPRAERLEVAKSDG